MQNITHKLEINESQNVLGSGPFQCPLCAENTRVYRFPLLRSDVGIFMHLSAVIRSSRNEFQNGGRWRVRFGGGCTQAKTEKKKNVKTLRELLEHCRALQKKLENVDRTIQYEFKDPNMAIFSIEN